MAAWKNARIVEHLVAFETTHFVDLLRRFINKLYFKFQFVNV